MKKLFCLISLLIIVLLSCNSPEHIAGTYYSKFPELGMFGTTVRLRSDSTLQYIFQGDLIHDSVTGHYQVYGNRVYVLFDKEVRDTNKLYYRFDNMPVKSITYSYTPVNYQLLLYIGHNKLFASHVETGAKVTRVKRYVKLKKYLFFGSHYYKKRYFYKRKISHTSLTRQ